MYTHVFCLLADIAILTTYHTFIYCNLVNIDCSCWSLLLSQVHRSSVNLCIIIQNLLGLLLIKSGSIVINVIVLSYPLQAEVCMFVLIVLITQKPSMACIYHSALLSSRDENSRLCWLVGLRLEVSCILSLLTSGSV